MIDWQYAAQRVAPIDNEELIGVFRQFIKAPKVAQHDFERDVFTHGYHFEIHQCADGILRIGKCRMQLFALVDRQRAEYICDHLLRQIRCEVRYFVGIEFFGCCKQLVWIHVRDQRFANRIRHLKQNVAVHIGLDQMPNGQALVEWQLFEDGCDVCRMQGVELVLQLGDVLLVHQSFDKVVARHVLHVHQPLDELVLLQYCTHLRERLLDAVNAFALVLSLNLGHCLLLLSLSLLSILEPVEL